MSSSCVFCELVKQKAWIVESKHFGLVWDIAPLRNGHLLIITKAHHDTLSDLSTEEHHELIDLQLKVLRSIKAVDPSFDATFILNNGLLKDEGTHFHLHVLPRQPHDGFWEGKPASAPFPKTAFLDHLSQ